MSKRDAILLAAREAFLRDGYGGTSMDQLAEDAGVARRTLYNQFANKEALFRAVVADLWKNLPSTDIVQLAMTATYSDNVEASLTEIGMAIANHWAPPVVRAFLRMVIVEEDRFPELPGDFYRFGKEPIIQAVQDFLIRKTEEGRINVADPLLATQQFIGMINEPLIWLRLVRLGAYPDIARREEVVRSAVHSFLRGYAV